MTVRKVRPGDESRLREIAAASKAHWGYDAERVRTWATELDLSAVVDGETYVADVDGTAVGWVALLFRGDICELDHLWIEPEHIGRGIGGQLFRFATARARELGASRLELESEPNAVGFYERLGAAQVGETTGSWGRPLPVLSLDLRG